MCAIKKKYFVCISEIDGNLIDLTEQREKEKERREKKIQIEREKHIDMDKEEQQQFRYEKKKCLLEYFTDKIQHIKVTLFIYTILLN